MQKEWIDIREKRPPSRHMTISVQIQVPCYVGHNDDGSALTAYVDGKFVDDWKCGYSYPFSIDLTNKKRKWKWKLNENDKNHYEDLYAWGVIRLKTYASIPENYHYYRRKKNEFKTFGRELPINGTSIILQFETEGHIFTEDDGYYFAEDQPYFMWGEWRAPLKIHLEQEDFILKWKDNY